MAGKIFVVGIGPGDAEEITPSVREALSHCDVVVGYKYYFRFIENLLPAGVECVDSAMRRERERAKLAFELAESGKSVCVISSGDSGVYGMAPLIFEMKRERELERGAGSAGKAGSRAGSDEASGGAGSGGASGKDSCATGGAGSRDAGGEGSGEEVEVVVLPGISAALKAASLLGAPLGHDFCAISLSDLMTPWEVIERRIVAAAKSDFVTAVYNPRSSGRQWQLERLREIFMQFRSGDTPVGCVRQAGREDEKVWCVTLSTLDPEEIDMFTVLIIGNSQSYIYKGAFVTPRGYYRETEESEPATEASGLKHCGDLNSGDGGEESDGCNMVGEDGERLRCEVKGLKPGQEIMMRSFATIEAELKNPDIPREREWLLLHAIHTTADFEMEQLLYIDEGAPERIFSALSSGAVKHIITDVTMVASGIRKGALKRLGLEVKCYLADERVAKLSEEEGITRTQAGIRLAVEEHPDALYVFGNAPTALMELCTLISEGKAKPLGVIGAPVGFVNVCESKRILKSLAGVDKIIVEGRKGGSNVAATLVNALLCFDDSEHLRPGRDL